MKTDGLIDYPSSGSVALTRKGAASAVAPSAPPSLRELHDRIREILEPRKWRVLEVVIRRGEVDRETLAAESDYSHSSSGFEKVVSQLRSLGFIDYPSGGMVAPTDVLVPRALARST